MQSSRLRWLSLAALLAWSPGIGAQTGGDAGSTEYDAVIAAARAAAREAYQLGQKEYEAGDYAAAYGHFKLANQRMPTPHAQYWMAMCLDKQGKSKEALDAFGDLLGSPDLHRLGDERVKTAKERHRALQKELAAKRKPPASGDAGADPRAGARDAYRNGKLAFEAGDYAAAHDYFKTANGLIPTVQAQYWMARSLDKQGKREAALDAYGTVLFHPDSEKLGKEMLEVARTRYRALLAGAGPDQREETVEEVPDEVGTWTGIQFINQLSGAYRLERVSVVVDGDVRYQGSKAPAQPQKDRKKRIFAGPLGPGQHLLEVVMELRGAGYGFFSYTEGYRFIVSSAHLFDVQPGEPVQISVVAWEKDWVTNPMERRLTVNYLAKPTTRIELEAAVALREHRSPQTLGVIRQGWAWLL